MLEKLEQFKDEILKAEIGALLFNLGKTHIGIGNWKNYFNNVQTKFDSYKDYYNKKYFEDELKNVSQNLRNFIFNEKVKIDNKEIDWVEFFKGDASNEDFIQKIFFRGCENINSGIDKGSPNKQLEPPLWLSNAFGSFKEEIKEEYFDEKRNSIFCELKNFLDANNYYQNPNWQDIRNFILEKIKKWYSHLLSDSRFPINDVTLFDQAYMTASMFKAVLSQLIIDNSKLNDYQNNPSSIKWRILGIQYDKLGLAEKGYKPSQIMWYRDISKEIDKEIQHLLETEYPIGNEIYRDETGMYFIVGENFELSSDFKEKILNIFNQTTKDEFYPSFELSKPSRGLMNLTTLLEKAKENFLKQDLSLKNKDLYIEYNGEEKYPIGICQVCKTRIVYNIDKKDDNKNICSYCYEKKTKGRLTKWLQNQKDETIWIDEIADENNRVALITLKFELMEWLNGDLLSSLLIRNIDWNNIFQNLNNLIIDSINFSKQTYSNPHYYQNNQNNFKKFYNLFDNSIGNIFNLLLNKLNDILNNDFNNIQQEISQLKVDLQQPNLSNSQKNSKKKKLNFLEKLPDLKLKIKTYIEDERFYLDLQYKNDGTFNILNQKNQNDIKSQITFIYFYEQISNLILERSIGSKWEEFIYKELKDWDSSNNKPLKQKIDFENRKIYWNNLTNNDIEVFSKILLQFILRKNPSPARLKRIWDTTNEFFNRIKKEILDNCKGYRTKESFEKKVPDFAYLKDKIQESEYKQYISIIDPTPISWQFILPTNRVNDVIKKIQHLYKKEFKYVYGKLPLHIGIVVQNSKFPLYIGIKALRKIRRDIKNWSDIKIKGKDLLPDLKCYEEVVEQNNNAKDYYSLYECDNNTYPFKNLPSNKGVKVYNENENFIIYPNTIDFEFLDTNSRREDIVYKNGKRDIKMKSNRPYTWEEFEFFKNFKEFFKNKTALMHRLVSLIYSKMQDWENNEHSFKKFIKSTFIQNDINIREFGIKDYSFDEMKKFLDMFDYYHTTLKEI